MDDDEDFELEIDPDIENLSIELNTKNENDIMSMLSELSGDERIKLETKKER